MVKKVSWILGLLIVLIFGGFTLYNRQINQQQKINRVPSGPSDIRQSAKSVGKVNDQVWRINAGNVSIYGHLYTPKNTSKKQLPIAIVSHGLGGNYQELANYARNLAQRGYLAYAFDFPGGSIGGKSTGIRQTQMSIFTEEQNLRTVIKAVKERQDASSKPILLVGGSQGAVVTALTASRHPQGIGKLALMYPAFSITHDAQHRYQNMSEVPSTTNIFGFNVGSAYYKGLLQMDITETATKFNGPVLIVHGNADDVVPVKYVRKAADNFPHAQFHVLAGAGHGFEGSAQKRALKYLDQFIK